VRVKYDPALALTGQVYDPWRYIPAYLIGNSTAPAPENIINDMSQTIKQKSQLTEKYAESISVYSNPASNKLTIEGGSASPIKSFELVSTQGKSVYWSSTGSNQIDVSKLAPANYILIITHQDGLRTSKKILIQR